MTGTTFWAALLSFFLIQASSGYSLEGEFSVDPPNDWRAIEGKKAEPLVTFVGNDPKWRVMFIVTKERVLTGMDVTEYTKDGEKAPSKALPDFKVLSKKTRKLDKEKAREYLYTYTAQLPGGALVKMAVRVYATIHNGHVYSFTFRAPPEIYEKYVKDFEEMVLSLKWDKEKDDDKK